jgi:hypothetical protein
MCGLIAWTTRPPDADALTAAVARRGPHTHGWAVPHLAPYGGSIGGWTLHGGPGPLTDPPPGLALGHSRLATSGAVHGGPPPDTEYQPLTHGPRVLAHNGTLPDTPQDRIDSCWLLAQPDPHDYLIRHGGRHALITIDLHTRTLAASTTGQPLYLRDDPGSLVLTSVPLGPGFRPLPRNTTVRSVLP